MLLFIEIGEAGGIIGLVVEMSFVLDLVSLRC